MPVSSSYSNVLISWTYISERRDNLTSRRYIIIRTGIGRTITKHRVIWSTPRCRIRKGFKLWQCVSLQYTTLEQSSTSVSGRMVLFWPQVQAFAHDPWHLQHLRQNVHRCSWGLQNTMFLTLNPRASRSLMPIEQSDYLFPTKIAPPKNPSVVNSPPPTGASPNHVIIRTWDTYVYMQCCQVNP